MKTKLRMTGRQHELLMSHLYPGDGKEAVAFALCGRRNGNSVHALSVRAIHTIPYEKCPVRRHDCVTWETDAFAPILRETTDKRLTVIKFHSHPCGLARFSPTDDVSDRELLASVQAWTDSDLPHGSVCVLPDGSLFGRWMTPEERLEPIDVLSVVGDDLNFWFASDVKSDDMPGFAWRNAQAFGAGTTGLLRQLSVAVVGCSGTGSPMLEMLMRHNVGHLVLVDPDRIDEKNLNRITFARKSDIGQLKVEVAEKWIKSVALGTVVEALPHNLCEPAIIRRVAECDVVVGCMDSAEGRWLLNKLATFYCMPYFDVGIRLDADGHGGINQICGSVNYLQPGGSSLLSRKVITMRQVEAEGLKRTNPEVYATQLKDKYIHGVQEDRPAVVSINMHYASLTMLEILARLHPFRVEGNEQFARFGSSLTDPRFAPMDEDGAPCQALSKHVGRGDTVPLLDNPYLSEVETA
ncbi:ThiF family adenylyltransferase [Thalassoglobus polymorphus]|uniref:Sulfur carrier protein ThiS adenylyltransferase n=1 Tax=Thalassoglobus polymorphus TaxID=2527994 RepID=A0A517QQN3_9PLAN|nr:ThiF family adenylyltransferase [Thalassoglobus polymorphus]QDT33946.1 Sulfur carrier protein ThiS adenylyltransferase [Thalassoglobus polymorphus]